MHPLHVSLCLLASTPAESVIKHPKGAPAFICLFGKEALGCIKN